MEYSINGGATWVGTGTNYVNTTSWTQESVSLPAWDNAAAFKIRFKWQNGSGGLDPAFSIDEGLIQGTSGGGSNAITTGTGLTPTSWCVGSTTTLQVDFTSTGTFNSGNVYSAELSDAAGSFAAPTVVGTLASTANSGTITAVIPGTTPVGNGYRIRVVSDNPATVGTDNGSDLSITSLPTVTQQSFSDVCLTGGAVNLSGASPAGGTYSGTGVSGTTFDPSVSGLGTFPITYTFTNGNGCTNSAVEPITVVSGPAVTQAPFSDVCSSGGVITLVGGSPAGGTYSGTGVTGSQFDPSVAGLGSFPVTYTYTDAGGCSGSAVETITVVQGPAVTLDPFTPVCNTDPFFTLTGGTPSNGTYTGPGITGGVFDPSAAGVGVHTITYTFTDANGCSGTANQTIQVDICGSIGEIAQVNFTVYPNPAENTFTLKSDGIIDGVALADLSGRVIKNFATNDDTYQVEEVPTGVYLLHVVVDGKRQTTRLVIR